MPTIINSIEQLMQFLNDKGVLEIAQRRKDQKFKKFQNGLTFDNDINYSIKNTHSRNGLIKFNENKFVYLGLENEGYSDNIYVTLEVVALTENTKYFKLVKK